MSEILEFLSTNWNTRYANKRPTWDAGVFMHVGQGADLHMAQLMPLPLTVSCSSKSRLVFYLSGTDSPG